MPFAVGVGASMKSIAPGELASALPEKSKSVAERRLVAIAVQTSEIRVVAGKLAALDAAVAVACHIAYG